MFTTSFSSLENETITEEMRTIKPGYRLAVKLNPKVCPGFFYLASQEKGPLCQIRREVKKTNPFIGIEWGCDRRMTRACSPVKIRKGR